MIKGETKMRARWLTAAFLLVVLTVVWVVACAAEKRPAESVSPWPCPGPEVNAQAVIWRTPEPPKEAQAADVWVNPKDGMEMVYVPAGEFLMGSTKGAGGYRGFVEERPQCRVNLPGYWIGRTEVTNAQYRRFVQATGHRAPEHWKGGEAPSGLESFPVVFVNWEDARAYCEWAGGRLPSELEWEKAARGADGRVFPWGNEWDSKRCRNFQLITGSEEYLIEDIWLSEVSRWLVFLDPVREGPAAVGSYRAGASPYGCLDMAGNVGEWCADWYEGKAYERYAKGDLKPPGSGTSRAIRGGTWIHGRPGSFRCADRYDGKPDDRLHNVGFRCVRGLP